MSRFLIVLVICITIYNIAQPSLDKNATRKLVGDVALATQQQISKSFEKYEEVRQSALKNNEPEKEAAAFQSFKSDLESIPSVIQRIQ